MLRCAFVFVVGDGVMIDVDKLSCGCSIVLSDSVGFKKVERASF